MSEREWYADLVVRSDSLKMLRETLCRAQSNTTYPQEIARLQPLIAEIDRHRPLGPDGVHGDRHTATCGCEDRGTIHDWVVHTLKGEPGRASARSQAMLELLAQHQPAGENGWIGFPNACVGCGWDGYCAEPDAPSIEDCPVVRAFAKALVIEGRKGYELWAALL